MSKLPDVTAEVDDLLVDYPPHIGLLVQALRRVIWSVMPEATERVYGGWRGIGYHHPKAGYVWALFPTETAVRIGFEHGHLLHDPGGLLEGRGKQVRYLNVTELDPDVVTSITAFIDQAIELR